jgi:hypothetical protein
MSTKAATFDNRIADFLVPARFMQNPTPTEVPSGGRQWRADGPPMTTRHDQSL